MPLFTFESLFLFMGHSAKEAENTRKRIVKNIYGIGIHNNEKVVVIYDNDSVIAIGRTRNDKWIHVKDRYNIKTFKELNLKFDSLCFI